MKKLQTLLKSLKLEKPYVSSTSISLEKTGHVSEIDMKGAGKCSPWLKNFFPAAAWYYESAAHILVDSYASLLQNI